MTFPDNDPMEGISLFQDNEWLYSPEMTLHDVKEAVEKSERNVKRWKRLMIVIRIAMEGQTKIDLVRLNQSINDRAKERNRGKILSQLGEDYVTESQFEERMKLNGFKPFRKGKKNTVPNLDTLRAVLFTSGLQKKSSTNAYQELIRAMEYHTTHRKSSALPIVIEPLNLGRKTSVSKYHKGQLAQWPMDPLTCPHRYIENHVHGGPALHKTKKCLHCGQVFELDFMDGMALMALPETPQNMIQSLYHDALCTEFANYMRLALMDMRNGSTTYTYPQCWCRKGMKIRYVPSGSYPSSRPVLACGNDEMIPPANCKKSEIRNDRWEKGCGVVRDLRTHASMAGKFWLEPALGHLINGDYNTDAVLMEVHKQGLPLVSPSEFEQIANYQHLKTIHQNPVMKVEHEARMMKSCITIFDPAVMQTKTSRSPRYQAKDYSIVQKITPTGLETWCHGGRSARYPGFLPMNWHKIALNDHAGMPPDVGTVGLSTHRNAKGEEEYNGYVIGILDKDFTKEHCRQDQKGRWAWSEEAKKLFPHLPKEARHSPTPDNEAAMKKMSDDEMVKIVMTTVEEYLSEEFLTKPQPAPMKQINSLLDCLESRLYDRLDLVHLRNVLLISDRVLLINLANRLGLTLTYIEKSTERSTGKKEFSSTTGSSSSAKTPLTSIRKSGSSSTREANQARSASIGPVEVKEYPVGENVNMAPTARTQLLARNIHEKQIPKFGIHVISAEAVAAAQTGERVPTGNEDTWSTTAMDGSNPQSKSRNKQIASAAMTAQQAELIERHFVKEALAKVQTEEVASGKKHARGYPSSSSPSTNKEEEVQINRCVDMLKDLIHEKKLNMVEAEKILLDLIVAKDRETQNATGSSDTKILHAAVQRLREAGVE